MSFPGICGIAFKDLASRDLVLLRGDEIFPAASVIKIHILVELFKQAEEGRVDLEKTIPLRKEDKVGGSGVLMELHEGISLTLKDLATLMIVISDNTASNMLIDIVGMQNVNRRMRKFGLEKTVLGRKFMTRCDLPPANFITPTETMLLLEGLAHGRFLRQDLNSEVLRILKRQQYNEKIPLLLPRDLPVAHKTGEISGVRNDAGIVFLPERPYVLCIFSKEVTDELKADAVIAKISRLIFMHCSGASGEAGRVC